MENLGGGVGSGLGCLARTVVVGFGGEVYAAVYSSIRQHGACLISLASGEICKGGREGVQSLEDSFNPLAYLNKNLSEYYGRRVKRTILVNQAVNDLDFMCMWSCSIMKCLTYCFQLRLICMRDNAATLHACVMTDEGREGGTDRESARKGASVLSLQSIVCMPSEGEMM